MKNGLNICIVGGGNSTLTLIPLLSSAGHKVFLLTRNPDNWSSKVIMEYTDKRGQVKDILNGRVLRVSDDPSIVIPDAEVIILSLPVSAYRIMLNRIAPYVNKTKQVIIGTIYGQGGFNWMMEQVIRDFHLDGVEFFSIGLLPWITRTKEYGNVGINYGAKYRNVIALSNPKEFYNYESLFLDDICYNYFGTGKFLLSENFLSLTMSVDNQIIHLSRLYGLFLQQGGVWDSIAEVPLFYKDFDDVSAGIMAKLDNEYSKIREAIKKMFPEHDYKYMLDYLSLERFSYNSCNTDIKESFTSSETLGQIPTPVVRNNDGKYVFDKDHRFFKDDLYYGLVVAKWFAQKLKINDTPTLNEIICWAQQVVGDEVLRENELVPPLERNKYLNGNPDVYGYTDILDYID